MSLRRRNLNALRQSGNVFFALFGAIAMVGVLGGATMTVLKGPVAGMQKVTKYTVAENNIIAAATLISRHSLGQPEADCDGDGIIEPVPFHTGEHSGPQGGGSIPANIGVTRLDPWGTEYGYCVWDHGSAVKAEGCGGAEANRLSGGVTDTGIVMAIMSAGPDRVFQTSCLDWVDDETPVVNKPTGSDDLVKLYPYAQFLLPTSARSQLEELPNEACTPETIGIMRISAGSVEVCLESGWSEISGIVPEVEGNFVDVIGAERSSTDHLSGAITFTQFNGSKPLSVQGNATVLINGQPATQPISISAGDTVELRANAPDGFEESQTFSVSLGSVTRQWRISTRAAQPASLTITPSVGNFSVTGPGTPAYSSPIGFIVRNMGEQITNALTAQLTPLASYEYAGAGDLCGGVSLAPYDQTSAQCVVDVRAKSSGEALPAGTLTVGAAGISSVTAPLSGTISGFDPCVEAGGARVGGECWFLGSYNQSCTTVCSGTPFPHYSLATRDYAGSGGSNPNCQAVLTALEAPGTTTNSYSHTAAGCGYSSSLSSRFRMTVETDPNQSSITARRACACRPLCIIGT